MYRERDIIHNIQVRLVTYQNLFKGGVRQLKFVNTILNGVVHHVINQRLGFFFF